MKLLAKRMLVVLIAAICIISIAACSKGGVDADQTPKNGAYPLLPGSYGDESESATVGTVSTPINFNETVVVGDVMEITLEEYEWLDEIKPSNTTGAYSYKSDNVGEKYFVIRGKVKNIAGDTLDISYAHESELIINGRYKANINIDAEESDGTGFYGDVKPLQTLNIVIYASVSDELYEICENIDVTFNLLSDSSRVGYFFDMDDPHATYSVSFAK